MLSALAKACADGDREKVYDILNDPATLPLLKDQVVVAPLLDAIKGGHVDILKVLLDKGADPNLLAFQGPFEHFTSDPVILDILRAAAHQKSVLGANETQASANDKTDNVSAYAQPESYTYYPTINPSLSTVNEGGYYYPQPQGQPGGDATNGLGNLPPPEIARLIPCRYFPACRYGPQCMFAHPPQGTYFQGPMPPVQYPPFESMGNPYIPPYYPPPTSFQQPPPPVHSMSPMSPPSAPPIMHARSPSEVVSPPPPPFSPNGHPAPPPAPYGPLSPPIYSHPGQLPLSIPGPPIPPVHPQPHHIHPGPHSPLNMYSPSNPPPPFALPQDGVNGYAGPHSASNPNGAMKMPEGQQDAFNGHVNPRDGPNGQRRGAGRRPSFSTRKPPCLFFPAGRCKNGDDCRFPHVLPENGNTPTTPSFPNGNGRALGPRTPRGPPNGINGIEAKLGNMTIHNDQPRQRNGVEPLNRPSANDLAGRPKFPHPGKHNHHVNGNGNGNYNHNGNNGNKRPMAPKQQRVPSADDFPVLAGTITPPYRPATNGVNGHSTPTAAQVLQAPAPARKDGSKESSTRGTTPDLVRNVPSKDDQPETNGVNHENDTPVKEQVAVNGVGKPPVMSFAAAAAASAAASDVAKEVSVSA